VASSREPAAHLAVDRLSVRFPGRGGGVVEALRDVSLALPKGEIATVLGPSGCGKTTLLNVVAGFLEPTEGEVWVDGRPVAGPGPERGMVFQQGALFEWMSVADNVAFGPRMKGMPGAQRREIVDRLLDVVGLAGFGDRAPYELSGGMQQRVALARCLANDPEVILMDEPLGALDALTREKMQGLILKVWRETGTTILLITHSVEEALLLGRRLVVMAPRPGRIFREESLPFAEAAAGLDLREIKRDPDFARRREEVLSLIWDMEEEIMGTASAASAGAA
jgi:taurine transport system ATP-binding protein